MQRIPEKWNIADTLNKQNIATYRLLNVTSVTAALLDAVTTTARWLTFTSLLDDCVKARARYIRYLIHYLNSICLPPLVFLLHNHFVGFLSLPAVSLGWTTIRFKYFTPVRTGESPSQYPNFPWETLNLYLSTQFYMNLLHQSITTTRSNTESSSTNFPSRQIRWVLLARPFSQSVRFWWQSNSWTFRKQNWRGTFSAPVPARAQLPDVHVKLADITTLSTKLGLPGALQMTDFAQWPSPEWK